MSSTTTQRIAERFAGLSPEQRRAVYRKISQEGLVIGQFPILERPASSRNSCPASYAQVRQWFLWQLDPDSSAYHISGALWLRGALDGEALRASFDALVARHEALRTLFRSGDDGQVEQVILPEARAHIEQVDLRQEDTDARDRRLRAEIRRLQQTPFDLETGPLLRLGLIRESADAHLLVVVMHHSISDGWSIPVIVNEFSEEYGARVQGREAAHRPLPVQYADYALWQRNWLEAGEKERQLGYWRAQLGGEYPVLQLPADHPRGADGRYRAARHRVAVPGALAERLRARAAAAGTTLFTVLLTGFQALLHRYSGLGDIRVGVPIANRHRVETEGLVGFFVNTQVLRNLVDPRTSLQQLLERAGEAALGAQGHQDLPFEQLVEALAPERNLNANPLFQVMFNHQRQGRQTLDSLPGLALEAHELEAGAAQFELTLDTREDAEGKLGATFTYAAELFEPATVGRMAGHYLLLLEALAERPESALGDIQLLGEVEQKQLAEWGVMENPHGELQPVHRLIELLARENPDAEALVFGGETLSFSELNTRANRLAHQLISLGVRAEVRVGIATERSLEMIVGLLAILKAGGAYVPLETDYPRERLAWIIEDSGIELLLTQSHLQQRLPIDEGLTVLLLDRQHSVGACLQANIPGASESSHWPENNPAVAVHGENLAYVIYTSGSTGRPKGAAIRHSALASCMAWMQQKYQLTREDTVLHKAPFGFDVSAWEIFWPLTAGVRLVVANPGDHRDPERIIDLIRRHKVTALNFVPAMLQAFLAHPGIEKETKLRYVICGGEAMPAATQREALERLQGVSLQNLYGPTETTIHVTQWTCRDDDRGQVPIGRPISATRAYVLDESLNRVPQGVAGELYIGGELLGRGYLHRPDLSAERFVADPFGEGERLYRTGDLVRWNDEGQLEYLGRIDHQVKIRGLRIELGEIEAQLLAQPEVREAVAVAKDNRLLAYVSARAGVAIDNALLRERLSQTLPDYMLPAAIVELQGLPLNANGKVDRKALPEAELQSGHYEAPQGETEQTLASIWAELLNVQRVGRNDNFFELGGHSLLALTLLERMRVAGLSVQVRSLFQRPVLADFAAAIGRGGRGEVAVPPNRIPQGCDSIAPEMLTLVELDAQEIARIEAAIPGGAVNIQDIYPLAPLQEGMLFHHMLDGDADAYVTAHILSFDRRERLEAFIASFNRVIERHDILRTAVLWEGLGTPVQVVCREAPLQAQWLPGDLSAEQLKSHIESEYRRIDVRRAPMMRALAAPDADGSRWLLGLPGHHLVMDHTTLERIVEEIGAIQRGDGGDLPEPLPFRNFVARARLGVSEEEHEAFFTEMLGDVEEPTVPFGLLDVRGDGRDILEASLPLPADLARRLREQAQRRGVGAASLFHLAWALVLGKISGRDDVVFGTVLFGRLQGGEGAERALGMFINTLPIRVRLGARPVAEALRLTHAALTGLLEHEHASLALAQRCSGLPGGAPLFSALLNYRYNERKDGAGGGEIWEGVESLGSQERTNYPLGMSVNDLGSGFELVAQVHSSVGGQRVCEYLCAAVSGIVAALERDPERALAEIQLLGETEQEQLTQWSVNEKSYPDARPVHRLIEQQARENPDAEALVFGDETLSFSELNTRANRLAHQLIGLGVKPEVKVGIATERSLEMIVGLLAILKAGGAYVPLETDYPPERLAWIIEDSGIELLLTQSHLQQRLPIDEGLTVLLLDRQHSVGACLQANIPGASESSHWPENNPAVAVHGENLAYVIYTSGSTGRPKGAAIRHSALASCMAWMQQKYQLTRADTLLHKAPFGFDVSAWEIFWPLTAGVRLVVANPGDHRDPERIIDLIRRHQVTTLNFVPAMLQAFLSHPDIEKETRLRYVICGGEAMPAATQREALERLQGVRLQNLYGPTETTIHVTQWTCRNDGRGQVPIGRPISATNAYVLDESLNRVPQGVAGELYIGGELLGRGYLHRPDLSAERFVADPFSTTGERLYRTGDLVRWNGEGQLEYLGRIDHQVKIRGLRIELGEIEAQLLAQPEVREVVAVAKDNRLQAYVSARAGMDIDSAQLRERLGQILPDYMLPGAIVVLENLPLNANGKVDRKALPEVDLQSACYEAPQGEAEEILAQVWAEVLGVDQVGRNDNFFELGGHSLLAIRAVEAMRKRGCGYPSLTLSDLYARPTVGELAAGRGGESGIVRLNGDLGNDTPPLILIHDGYGNILDYTDLARALGDKCTVLTLPYQQKAGSGEYSSLHDLARAHARTILDAGLKPPYRIGGWSLGGALAPLVAGILEGEGRQVEFVGAVDPYVQKPGQFGDLGHGEALLQFTASLLRDPSGLKEKETEVRKKIAQATESVDAIAFLLDELLSQVDPAQLREHGKLGGESLARLFVTGRELGKIARAPIEPLSLRTSVSVWWAQNRAPEDRTRYAEWLGMNVSAREMAGDHFEVIRMPQTLKSIAGALQESKICKKYAKGGW